MDPLRPGLRPKAGRNGGIGIVDRLLIGLALQEADDAMARARDLDDRLAIARADTAFHQAIVENSANEHLIDAYRLVSGRVAALRTHNLLAARTIRDDALAEHRALMAAFAKNDLATAEAVLSEHIWRLRPRFQAARARQAGEPSR